MLRTVAEATKAVEAPRACSAMMVGQPPPKLAMKNVQGNTTITPNSCQVLLLRLRSWAAATAKQMTWVASRTPIING
jgi:hypothetical protein